MQLQFILHSMQFARHISAYANAESQKQVAGQQTVCKGDQEQQWATAFTWSYKAVILCYAQAEIIALL